jgi:Saxitoxin biosynthesis operon protein SxtJ
MAGRVPARLTAAEGRKFGLTVGLAFTALGAIAWWRHRPTTESVFLALGAALILAGLAVPTSLGPVQRAWMGLAHKISKVTTPIFMGVVYYLVLTPIGAIRRATGSPLTARRAPGASRWEPHVPAVATAERMERQF